MTSSVLLAWIHRGIGDCLSTIFTLSACFRGDGIEILAWEGDSTAALKVFENGEKLTGANWRADKGTKQWKFQNQP